MDVNYVEPGFVSDREPYTPTTNTVRIRFGNAEFVQAGLPHADGDAAFDRWLQGHDGEVAARALREVADAMPIDLWATYGGMRREGLIGIWGWLSDRASALEGEQER